MMEKKVIASMRTIAPSTNDLNKALNIFEVTLSSGSLQSSDTAIQRAAQKKLESVNEVLGDWVYGSPAK